LSVEQAIGNALIIASAVLALAFVVLYAAAAGWWRSEGGRNVMALMGSIAAVLALATVKILVGDAWWFVWLRLAVFAAVPAALGWRLSMLWRAQVRGRFGRASPVLSYAELALAELRAAILDPDATVEGLRVLARAAFRDESTAGR
jgi:hypothetical protein